MAAYTVYLLNTVDDQVRQAIEARAKDAGVPADALQFVDTAVDAPGLAAGVFWGSTQQDATAVRDAATLAERGVPFIPVFEQSFTATVPACLGQFNGFDRSVRGLDDLANTVLETLELMRRRRRLFVSYLRKEATAAARQIYELLDERGYDVFLDTKTLLPGYVFQEELVERLADSDLVVFLHSPGVAESRWVKIERGLAEKLGIHVVALLWPDETQPEALGFSEPLPWGEARNYVEVEVAGERYRQLTLDPAQLDRLAQAVEAKRARALADRRRRVAGTFLAIAAEEKQISVQEEPPAAMVVELPGRTEFHLRVELGIPDVHALQRCDEAATQGERGILYDAGSAASASRKHLEWLRELSPIGLFDINTLQEGDASVEQWLQQQRTLARPLRPVFLSASIPYDKPGAELYLADIDRDAIREAVLALVRVVLPRAELHYGGHPAITPFVAQVALEDHRFERVKVYQSRRWEGFYPRENRLFHGIEFVETLKGELEDASLLRMRKRMLREGKPGFFSAAFFIGGMKGVEDELALVRQFQPEAPCFIVGTTGGAARILHRRMRPESSIERRYHEALGTNRLYGPLFRRILRELTR